MNFGFRLPGPFRVGISDKGRVTAGASLGPFSVSGGVGGAQRTPRGVYYEGLTLESFVAQAEAAGFSAVVTPGTSATVERRWMAMRASVVPGRGLLVRRSWSTWQVLTVVAAAVALPLVCCLPGYLVSVSH